MSDYENDDIARLQEMMSDLTDIRGKLGRVDTGELGDDYRQAKIDVADECLREVARSIAEYENAGVWPDE